MFPQGNLLSPHIKTGQTDLSDYSRPRKRAGRHEKRAGRHEKRAGRHEKRAGRKKCIMSLPNNKTLDWSTCKAFAADKFDVFRIMISVSDRVETLWEKEKMLVTSIFSFFLTMFSKGFFIRVVRSRIVYGQELNKYYCQTKAKILK